MTVINPLFFDFATPDPDFSGFGVEPKDQLPGRPIEGQIEIARFFDHLQLVVIEEQETGGVNGDAIFEHLRSTNAPVLGPNVGQFLYENQHLIPVELRDEVALVFWGKVYRDSGGDRCVWYLYWSGERWTWCCDWIDLGHWFARSCAVVLGDEESLPSA